MRAFLTNRLLPGLLPLALLAACSGDDDDPTGPTSELCNSLPEVDFPGSVDGSLTTGDSQLEDDTYFDAFRIQVPSDGAVRIDLTSGEFNTFLILLAPNESLLSFDDNGGLANGDSRIEENLQAGCYIVYANGFDTTSLGDYTLSVSRP